MMERAIRWWLVLLLVTGAGTAFAQAPEATPDPLFKEPYIDKDEWRDKPVRHPKGNRVKASRLDVAGGSGIRWQGSTPVCPGRSSRLERIPTCRARICQRSRPTVPDHAVCRQYPTGLLPALPAALACCLEHGQACACPPPRCPAKHDRPGSVLQGAR